MVGKEAQQIKSDTFGIQSSSFLSDDEFLEIYKMTGLDADDRILRKKQHFGFQLALVTRSVIYLHSSNCPPVVLTSRSMRWVHDVNYQGP